MPHMTDKLSRLGAIADFEISVSRPRRDALVRAGKPLPTGHVIRGLIDTGASRTCVDSCVLADLDLKPTGVVSIRTPSTGKSAHQAKEFDVSITLLHPKASSNILTLPVIESDLDDGAYGYQVLVGRDILGMCLFIYDGPSASFTLSF